MSDRSRLLTALLFGALAAGGCGGDDATTSGLDPMKPLNTLTDADRTTLCDWTADQFGGYGKSRACDARMGWPGPASAEACAGNLRMAGPKCVATVDTWESCQRGYFTADACKSPPTQPAACTAIFTCFAAR